MKNKGDEHLKLIFIYNADSGFFNGMLDSAHKLFSPKTYSCDLCAITHGLAGAKKEWRTFLESLSIPITYYHKDDRPESLMKYELPVILMQDSSGIRELVSAKEMKGVEGVEQLVDRINEYNIT